MKEKPLIYRLLPELYRRRDRENGLALEALAQALDEARESVEQDIDRLYRNWFVETCDPGMLPYLAELVGLSDLPEEARNVRAVVADAAEFGPRKGTYPATERMLGHYSGWPVLLAPGRGPGIVKVEVWRDTGMQLRNVTPHAAERAGCYRLQPMGVDCRLTTMRRPFAGYDRMSVRHLDAPMALTRHDDPALLAEAIEILVEGEPGEWHPLPAERLSAGDLSRWGEGSASHGGGSVHAIVDPELGRLRLVGRAAGRARVAVSFACSGAEAIGGGPYPRVPAPADGSVWLAHVHSDAAAPSEDGRPPLFASIESALEAYRSVPGDAVIRILDSATYEIAQLRIGPEELVCPSEPNRRRRLTIEAIDGEAPTLRGTLYIEGSGIGLELGLRGLWLDGRMKIEGAVAASLHHCTVHAISEARERHPDRPHIFAITARGSSDGRPSVHLDSSLVGPLRLGEGVQLGVRQSVVDGYGTGLAIAGRSSATLGSATILGETEFGALHALDTLCTAPARADDGSAAYSVLPDGSEVPGLHRCIHAETVPFRSARFGMAGYARIAPGASHALAEGASDGGEIGAFNSERNPSREKLLESALSDLLPIGQTPEIEWR